MEVDGDLKTRFQATKREGIYHRLTLTEESVAIEGQGLRVDCVTGASKTDHLGI